MEVVLPRLATASNSKLKVELPLAKSVTKAIIFQEVNVQSRMLIAPLMSFQMEEALKFAANARLASIWEVMEFV